jgi:hypothetical protein
MILLYFHPMVSGDIDAALSDRLSGIFVESTSREKGELGKEKKGLR